MKVNERIGDNLFVSFVFSQLVVGTWKFIIGGLESMQFENYLKGKTIHTKLSSNFQESFHLLHSKRANLCKLSFSTNFRAMMTQLFISQSFSTVSPEHFVKFI